MLQKRLDYGFIGYQVPPMPRATRSARVNICCYTNVANCCNLSNYVLGLFFFFETLIQMIDI